jgi:hypothetical protein
MRWASQPRELLPYAPLAVHTERGLLMETIVAFLDCPAYMDRRGAVRCGLPAEVESRYTVRSSDGPLESAKIRCPRGHWFNGPIEFLTWDKQSGAAVPRAAEAQRQGAASPSPRETRG